MRKRLVSLLFAGIMACSVIGSGVTTFAAENDSHINLALFTYIEGMDPATDWCGWNLTRCGVGETLVTVNENMETNIPGMYACGDCTGGIYQISKAVYEGMKAGFSVIQYLRRG